MISDGAGQVSLTKLPAESGTLILTGNNTFTGPVIIDGGGVVVVTSLGNIGQPSGIGAGSASNNAGSLIFGTDVTAGPNSSGGTLKYTGAETADGNIYQTTETPSVSTNRLFTIDVTNGGNAAIDSSGTYGNNVLAGGTANNAALVFNNHGDITSTGTPLAPPDDVSTLSLTGTSIGDNELDMHLVDNAADPNIGTFRLLAVSKGTNAAGANGIGLWILNPSTPNTYTGDTTIFSGILRAQDGMGLSSVSNLVFAGVSNNSGITNPGSNGTAGELGTGVLETSGVFNRVLGYNQTIGGPGGQGCAGLEHGHWWLCGLQRTSDGGVAGQRRRSGADPVGLSVQSQPDSHFEFGHGVVGRELHQPHRHLWAVGGHPGG